MNKKIPVDAFAFYWSLGTERSYQAVAEKYGVSKRAITSVANAENWQRRIVDLERKAHQEVDKKLSESIEQMNERHIKVCKLIQAKALEALKTMPVGTAAEAIRALDISIKQERLIRGEPTDRAAVNIEDVIKREYDRWMTSSNEEESDDDNGAGEAA